MPGPLSSVVRSTKFRDTASVQLHLFLRCIVWQLLNGKGFFSQKYKQTNNWRKKESLTMPRKSHELKQIKYKGMTGLENKKMRY